MFEPKREPDIAICGIDCANEWGIRRCPEDAELRQKHVDWFVSMGWKLEDIDPSGFKCGTCRGPREEHWSPDCELLKCATSKGHNSCSDCGEFPCGKLTEFASKSPRYAKAVDRLRGIKQATD
jgi:hypothetical protein